MGKTYLYGFLTMVRIKQHLPLESPVIYFIQIMIEFISEKFLSLTFEKSDVSFANVLQIDSIPIR